MEKSKKRIRGRKLPNTTELMTIYQELIKKPNVFGCYVGKKVKAGNETGSLSIICGVKDKIDKKDLKPEERIPSIKENAQLI